MKSKKFQLNKADLMVWSKDALKVLAPYLIVLIPVLIEQLPKEAFWTGVAIFILQRARVAIELFLKGK